jgi:phage tail-like protein
MEFAFNETRTADDWAQWQGLNFDVTDGGVEISTESLPTYIAPDLLVPAWPSGVEAVDLAADGCGDLYVLTSDGDVYRYDRGTEQHGRRTDRFEPLPCTWQVGGSPRAIGVSRESIYVASDDGVQAFSKHLLQTRWVVDDPFDSPLALATIGEHAIVLDAGANVDSDSGDGGHRNTGSSVGSTGGEGDGDVDAGGGSLVRLGPNGGTRVLAAGLGIPLDLAVDDEGRASVLTVRGGSTEIARFDLDYDERSTVSTRADATCLAVGDAGELLIGTSESPGEASLFCVDPDAEAFRATSAFDRSSHGLLLASRRDDGQLFVIGGTDHRVFVLDARRQRRMNPITDRYGAQVVRRFDAGVVGTQWHRVTMDGQLGGAGTQIRLSYYATDKAGLRYGTEPIALQAVDGIGPTYASRLRDAGVADLTDLLDLTPEEVSSAVSVEVLDVPSTRTSEWIGTARDLIDDRPDARSLDVEAVDGIGPIYGDRLRRTGIDTLDDLVASTAEALAAVASREIVTVSTDRTETWLDRAKRLLADRADVRAEPWTSLSKPNPKDAFLEEAEGRYLWVRIELVGDSDSSPRVDAFRAYFPRQSYLRHLPAIYREDERSAAFLERFLSIFESVFADIEEDIGATTRYLDANGVPAEHLSWLGDWLALEAGETWPTPAKRELLRRAPDLFKKRGTRAGLLEIVGIYLDHVVGSKNGVTKGDVDRTERGEVPPDNTAVTDESNATDGAGATDDEESMDDVDQIGDQNRVYVFEHTDLDCIDVPTVRDRYEEIVPCPQCFIVFVRSHYDDEVVDTIEAIVDAHQPAHATGRTAQLRSGIQLGGNSFLGINTTLPDRNFHLEAATLGKETVIGGHEQHGQFGLKSRLGTDSTIS